MIERRSRVDTRCEAEKRLIGERRSGAEQLAPHETPRRPVGAFRTAHEESSA